MLKWFFTVVVLIVCKASCNSQTLPSISSDIGQITHVLVSEVQGERVACDVCSLSQVAKYFACEGVEVCLIQDIFFKETENSLFLDSIKDKNKLNNVPFDLNGLYTWVIFNDTICNYRDLKPLDRLKFLKSNISNINSLRWDSVQSNWRTPNLNFVVSRTSDTTAKDNFQPSYHNLLYNNSKNPFSVIKSVEKDTIFCGQTIKIYETQIWLSSVCDYDTNCETDIISGISRFAQDEFHARNYGQYSYVSFRNDVDTENEEILRNRQEAANKLCWDRTSIVDPLAIPGGDYFRMDNLIFIGADMLGNYLTKDKWSRSLGTSSTKYNKLSIEEGIRKQFDGKDSSTDIIWVDNSSDTNNIYKYCDSIWGESITPLAPIFHIDLFFHPLGTINTSDSTEWYYLFSTLEDSLHTELELKDSNYKETKVKLLDSEMRLQCDLGKLGYKPCPIYIPLLIRTPTPTTLKIYSLVNGLFSDGPKAKIFYMPKYEFPDTTLYGVALNDARAKLKSIGIDLKMVQAAYSDKGGLHCKVKVLKRTR